MSTELWRARALLRTLTKKRIRTQVRREELVRVRRGVYARQVCDDEDELRALMLCLPAEAMLTMQSAARRHGFGVLPEGAVHVQLPPEVSRPRLPGLVVHHSVLPVRPVMIRGLPCVPAAQCAVDLARTVRRWDAMPVLDAALRTMAVARDDLRHELTMHRGLRGVRQARDLVALADGRAECRQESQLRLVLIDGGLPAPEPQVWVQDECGVPRFRIDLGYRERRVALT